jgi:hypothetical protein
MPTVNDAARITSRQGSVWRYCAGCALFSPLPPDTASCSNCTRPFRNSADSPPLGASDLLYCYAAMLGRIEAWAGSIPDVDDAERLDQIRFALTALNFLHPGRARVRREVA